MVDPAHPLGVVLGQVVVDGDHVHAVAAERVEIGGQRRDQGLALAGLHLRDVAVVQRGTTLQLHVEVPLAEHPLGGLPDGRECLRQQVVERLAFGQPLLELVGLGAQLLVCHRDEVVLDRVDLGGGSLELAAMLALADSQDLVEQCRHRAELPVAGVADVRRHAPSSEGAASILTGRSPPPAHRVVAEAFHHLGVARFSHKGHRASDSSGLRSPRGSTRTVLSPSQPASRCKSTARAVAAWSGASTSA